MDPRGLATLDPAASPRLLKICLGPRAPILSSFRKYVHGTPQLYKFNNDPGRTADEPSRIERENEGTVDLVATRYGGLELFDTHNVRCQLFFSHVHKS